MQENSDSHYHQQLYEKIETVGLTSKGHSCSIRSLYIQSMHIQ